MSERSPLEQMFFRHVSNNDTLITRNVHVLINLNPKMQDYVEMIYKLITTNKNDSIPLVLFPNDDLLYDELVDSRQVEIVFLVHDGDFLHFSYKDIERLGAALKYNQVSSQVWVYNENQCKKFTRFDFSHLHGFLGFARASRLFRVATRNVRTVCGSLLQELDRMFEYPVKPLHFDFSVRKKIGCLQLKIASDISGSIHDLATRSLDRDRLGDTRKETMILLQELKKPHLSLHQISTKLIDYQFRTNMSVAFDSINDLINFKRYFDVLTRLFKQPPDIFVEEDVGELLRASVNDIESRQLALHTLNDLEDKVLSGDYMDMNLTHIPGLDDQELTRVKKLILMREKVSVLCRHQTLEIIGIMVTLPDIKVAESESKKCPHRNVLVLAHESIYISGDVKLPGMNVIIFSPKWHVASPSTIDLSGEDALPPNMKGQKGGGFFGFGTNVIRSDMLTIISNGGSGNTPKHIYDADLVRMEDEACVKVENFTELWALRGSAGGQPGHVEFVALESHPVVLLVSADVGKDGNSTEVWIHCDESRYVVHNLTNDDSGPADDDEPALEEPEVFQMYKRVLRGHSRTYPDIVRETCNRPFKRLLRYFSFRINFSDLFHEIVQMYPFEVCTPDRAALTDFLFETTSYIKKYALTHANASNDEQIAMNFVNSFIVSRLISSKSYYKETVIDLQRQLGMVLNLFDGYVDLTSVISIEEIKNAMTDELGAILKDTIGFVNRRIRPISKEIEAVFEATMKASKGADNHGHLTALYTVKSITFLYLQLFDWEPKESEESPYSRIMTSIYQNTARYWEKSRSESIRVLSVFFHDFPGLRKYERELGSMRMACDNSTMSDDCRRGILDLSNALKHEGVAFNQMQFALITDQKLWPLFKSLGYEYFVSDLYGYVEEFKDVHWRFFNVLGDDLAGLYDNDETLYVPATSWDRKYRLLQEYKLILRKIFLHEDMIPYRRAVHDMYDGMQKLIPLLRKTEDVDDTYHLSTYLREMETAYPISRHVSNPVMVKKLIHLDTIIRREVLSIEIEKTKEAFKRWAFPFAKKFENILELPVSNKNHLITFINTYGLSLYRMSTTKKEEKNRVMPYDQCVVSSIFGENSKPFYEWDVRKITRPFKRFLEGHPVELVANVIKTPLRNLEVLKCKDVGLKFISHLQQQMVDSVVRDATIKMVHSGRSYYRYQGKIYRFDGDPVTFFTTGSRYANESLPPEASLSPYTTWTIQIASPNSTLLAEIMKDVTFVQLTGRGSYVDGCDEDLQVEKYYTPEEGLFDQSNEK